MQYELRRNLGETSPHEREFVSTLIDKDPLTGVYNRRKFEQDLALVIAMCDRTKKGTSLLMTDIDHFKKYNDENGHQQGDHVLRKVAQGIQKSLRDYDKPHIYRYGGEEFVVIIPDIGTGYAFNIGERLRKNVKATCDVSVSVGVSHYREIADNLQNLVNNADKALYESKEGGRDKVVVYEKAALSPTALP